MYFLYSLLLTIGVGVLLPRFLYDAARHGKYATGLGERAGRLPPVASHKQPIIWLHCVSVGETQAARPLVDKLSERYPSHALVVSTTTLTGQRVAREVYGKVAARIFYFPFDWAMTVRRALDAINPSVVLVMETELWPRFLRECRARRIHVAVVNGRISETSLRRYRIIKPFISGVVNNLDLGVMQTEADAGRINALGLARERIRVSGNIKFDADVKADGQEQLTGQLRARFQLNERRPLIVAASTHAPEERVIIEAFKALCNAMTSVRPRLLLAPRHPERFAEVAALLESSGLNWARRTAAPKAEDVNCDVILLDTIGELRSVYSLADIVFVGGSIAPVGGHNVLEPAASARCIVTGAHTSNFRAIVEDFLQQDALIQLPPVIFAAAPSVLAHMFEELLTDDERRRRYGENARRILEQNRGATERTVEMLAPLLAQRSEVVSKDTDRPLTSDL
ncbi:MAG TPA: 3-deoxy-D-manno-octulosonic acid transferase [Pyrinomonadaceae bacterium]|nr:3-deoxy-D-manno-octulosonic acid transferase [Pyrinomonadaceae bacterium]